jgi:Na+/H+ antiporter NhaD/arsenite permease-like protein
MSTQLLPSKTINFNFVLKSLKNDIVFTLSLILALASCLVAQPRISYINFKVLACLFDLMIVVKAFEELHILDKFAVGILNKCTDSRKVSLILILLSFFSSMLITNDIALITLVPLALIISKKSNINMLVTVILQTLAANIGSSLTPMGNPQNLFIFSYYKLSAMQFFVPVILFSISGLLWLYVVNHRNHNAKLKVDIETVEVKDRTMAAIWAVLFAIIILSVFGVINYIIVFILTLALTFTVNRQLLQKVDYPLLITFVCFFVFIGNLSNVPAISSYLETSLNSGSSTYFGSILLSQFISNVPCSIFLSKFTTHWRELLVGVNIGGMGTIIASMASVISYKLFIKENPESSKLYLLKFNVYNFVSLGVFMWINYFVLVK